MEGSQYILSPDQPFPKELGDTPFSLNALKQEIQQEENLFVVKSALDWISESSKRPNPKMLFDCFWFEGEVCILFADTNVGKSILAVQLGDSISRGERMGDFYLGVAAQPVLYLDFELSDKQFEMRYGDGTGCYHPFSPNFLRAEINPEQEIPKSFSTFEAFLSYSLERLIIQTKASVVIIDNITFLKSDNERAKDALPLMKELKALKNKYGLSILILAHTPKRGGTSPLSRNDLAGSKMLINFCDSAFAIGESQQETGMRYLKQIKARNTEIRYGSEHVALAQIEKRNSLLGFFFKGVSSENEHLKIISSDVRENRNQRVLDLKSQGFSNVKIAEEVGISDVMVGKILKRYPPTL